MFYLSDFGPVEGEKRSVGSILELTEAQILLLGWSRAEKEQTGLFVNELPENAATFLQTAALYVDLSGNPFYEYTDNPAAIEAQKEKDLIMLAIAELAETLLTGGAK